LDLQNDAAEDHPRRAHQVLHCGRLGREYYHPLGADRNAEKQEGSCQKKKDWAHGTSMMEASALTGAVEILDPGGSGGCDECHKISVIREHFSGGFPMTIWTRSCELPG
jgi:hypothetical protein